MKSLLCGIVWLMCAGVVWADGSLRTAIAQPAQMVESGQQAVAQLALADWMGPLAPVALSPFFGLFCLSAGSILIERGWLPAHPLLSGNSVLQNETVLIALLILTIITSLPRLTKVTKPIAQLADFLETYAGVVFMLVVQAAVQAGDSGMASDVAMASVAGTGAWLIMTTVTAFNMLVIQTVRLFFEMLIWLSPIPLLDALFEAMNKTFCLALVAVYVFHPGAALVVNLTMFALCLLFVRSAHRRLTTFRRHVLLPLWRRWKEGRTEANS